MANLIPIVYKGETLACLDPTQVKAVEPFVMFKSRPSDSRLKNFMTFVRRIFNRRFIPTELSIREDWTKISFKDGTFIRIRMPFFDYLAAYM